MYQILHQTREQVPAYRIAGSQGNVQAFVSQSSNVDIPTFSHQRPFKCAYLCLRSLNALRFSDPDITSIFGAITHIVEVRDLLNETLPPATLGFSLGALKQHLQMGSYTDTFREFMHPYPLDQIPQSDEEIIRMRDLLAQQYTLIKVSYLLSLQHQEISSETLLLTRRALYHLGMDETTLTSLPDRILARIFRRIRKELNPRE